MATQPPDTADETAEICTVVDAVDAIGSKWKLVVLNALRDDELRFNELKRSTGASSYTLSRVLDDLEADGFLTNRKEFDSPVASYYTLTDKGHALCPVFEALEAWGDEWL